MGFLPLSLLHRSHLSESFPASFGIQDMKFHYLFFVHSAKSYKIEYILTKESIVACIVYLDSYKSVEMSISFYRKLFSSTLTIPYLSSLTNAVQYMWT